MADRDWTHKGNIKVLKQSYENGNKNAPYDALEYCRAEKKPFPGLFADAIIKDYREGFSRKKMGRHARPEERVKQFGSDLRCYTCVSVFMQRGLNQTQAEEKASQEVGLGKIAVHKACKRFKQKYLAADLPDWIFI